MVIAMPTMAQGLPEISLQITPQFDPTNESYVSNNGLPAQIRASSNAQGVSVNVFAHTVSGYDRFRNPGVRAYIDPSSSDVYRQRSQATYTDNSTAWEQLGDTGGSFSNGAGSPVFPNDLLVTGNSVVRVILMPGTGYTINPNMRSVDITVRDTPGERCAAASSAPGGKYYMPHPQGGLAWGVCTCAAESRHSSVRRALDRTIPTAGPDGRFGTDDDGTTEAPEPSTGFLSRLAAQFHDPSYLYCDESPYKGLP